MRLLDLFCGAGGAAMGYSRAGFEVVGVDHLPQKHYPFEFHQADALEYVTEHGHEFDAIHASPPCQRYTMAQHAAKNALGHPDLVGVTRGALVATGKPYIIENVIGAPLLNAVILCGLSFGLGVRRHRLFEANFFILIPSCQCQGKDYYVIFGHEVRNRRHGIAAGRKNKIAEGRRAMGIEWMTRGELSEAIPPAYTEFIGRALMQHLQRLAIDETPTEFAKAE
jgi:DNA (cytosine-5)-methyltransferase 1